MVERSVLIITPFFAPQSHAAVFRAHKLAKYLPKHGWKPYVLTVDTNYLYNEDPGLLAELPPEVEIVRTRYVEPTLRGLRMALGGRERTFRTEKARLVAKNTPDDTSGPPSRSLRAAAGNFYTHALRHWMHSPDAHWSWFRPAVKVGRELVRHHNIEVVYSTAAPLSGHRIAAELQKLGPKWVADFRDPATYGRKNAGASVWVRERQRAIVRETLERADAVTGLSSTYGPILTDMYGAITKRPYAFIPTGLDDSLIPEPGESSRTAMAPAEPYLIHVGEIMPDQDLSFFRVYADAASRMHRAPTILVVGHEILNRQRLAAVVDRYGLELRVRFIDQMPQRELYRLITHAMAAVLAPGPSAYWWTNHAKLVDYAALRKPVLAVVPDPSEARSVLTKANLGIFLDGTEEQATAKLTAFLNGGLPSPKPISEECDRYLASSQVRSFVEVFEDLR